MENFYDSTLSSFIGVPSMIGEFGVCLWMLIMRDRSSFRKSG